MITIGNDHRHFRLYQYICHATGMEEDPKVTPDIQCLWPGGGVALT